MTDTEREEIRKLSKYMWNRFHNPQDQFDAMRCSIIHQNCLFILKGDESPELLKIFAKNLAALRR